MAEQILTTDLKAAYPNFKKCSDLPLYLLPERSFTSVVDQVGDKGILELGRPLKLETGISDYLNKQERYEALPDNFWQGECLRWPPMIIVRPVVQSVLDASNRIMSQYYRGKLKADPLMVCRSLMILAFAPFIPEGRPVLEDVSTILNGSTGDPAGLITTYANAVVNNELALVNRIDQSLRKYPGWTVWVLGVQEKAQSFSSIPKIIAITPPSSGDLAGVLAAMIKEARNV